MENKNPNYFPQCKICSKYNLGSFLEKDMVEIMRKEISDKIEFMVQKGWPGAKEYDDKYVKCEECFQDRLDKAEGKNPEVRKEKNEREEDKKFLESIGIKANGLPNGCYSSQ